MASDDSNLRPERAQLTEPPYADRMYGDVAGCVTKTRKRVVSQFENLLRSEADITVCYIRRSAAASAGAIRVILASNPPGELKDIKPEETDP